MAPRKKDDTAKKMLETAKQLVYSEGYEAVTVRKIAELTGCTFPLLYHYFHDLDDFLWSLRLNMIEDMIQELDMPAVKGDTPEETLQKVFLRYMDYFFKYPNVYRFFYFHNFKKSPDDEYAALNRRIMDLRAEYFSGLNISEKGSGDKSEMLAKIIIFVIHGMITLALSSNEDLTREAAVHELEVLMPYLFKETNMAENLINTDRITGKDEFYENK